MFAILTVLIFISACKTYPLISIPNNFELSKKLSDYGIFQGKAIDLKPDENFNLYELSTPLFTDYSEKQRLIKLPANFKLEYAGDKLPVFPDKSVLVKTFYYFNDKRDETKGKRLIETRILLKEKGKWNVGTYVWNKNQTEAFLEESGSEQDITWIDEKGKKNNIKYHIPSSQECTTCHQQSGNEIMPIGPKLRNLNINVIRNGNTVNQLQNFQDLGMINKFDIFSVKTLPNWNDNKIPLNDRARAYLDVNCAHCHNNQGYVKDKNMYFNYEMPLKDTNIIKSKDSILKRMEANNIFIPKMPKLGTTIPHIEGIELIKEYIKILN